MATFTYADLIEWSKERLPLWEQDALRRVLEKGALTSDDIAELAELAKAQPGQAGSSPVWQSLLV